MREHRVAFPRLIKMDLTSGLQCADEDREDVAGHEGVLRRRELALRGAEQRGRGGVDLLEADLLVADLAVESLPYRLETLVYLRPGDDKRGYNCPRSVNAQGR